MGEEVYENPMEEYMGYLKRYIRNSTMSIWQAHQHALCREVAREYGVTEEELQWLDENLWEEQNENDDYKL